MFTGISWVGVLCAGFAGTVVGGVWFGPKTFFPLWWRLIGHPPGTAANPGGNLSMAVVFGSTFLAQLLQAFAVAVIVNVARQSSVFPTFGVADGAMVGLAIGVGIAATAPLGHRLFGGHGFGVWALEVGSDLLGLVLMGAITAAMAG
jgi:hypothetical protein